MTPLVDSRQDHAGMTGEEDHAGMTGEEDHAGMTPKVVVNIEH